MYLSAGCDKSRDNSEKFSWGALGQLQCLQKKRTSLYMYMSTSETLQFCVVPLWVSLGQNIFIPCYKSCTQHNLSIIIMPVCPKPQEP